jgi:hypothetical protein
MPFPDLPGQPAEGRIKAWLRDIVRYHKQNFPKAKIKNGRIVRLAEGCYPCLFIDVETKAKPEDRAIVPTPDPGT